MALTAGTWRHVEPRIGAQAIAESSNVALHPLGTIIRAKDIGTTQYGEGEFIYVKGVASGGVRDWVAINPDNYVVSRAVANSIGALGVLMAALTASLFGWAQISGKAIGNCLTSFADNGYVNLTGTAGFVDDASVAGDIIIGAFGASTAVVGDLHAEFELNRPQSPQRVSIAG